MSALSIRLPDSLHERVRQLAVREGISINQLVATALAEKLAAMMTEEYLDARARRGDREKYRAALALVRKGRETYDAPRRAAARGKQRSSHRK